MAFHGKLETAFREYHASRRPAIQAAIKERGFSRDVSADQFLTPGGRTLISASAAAEHVWTSNNELMYVNTDADSVTLAHLEFGPTIKVARTALFDHRPYQHGSQSARRFDVSRDGKSFVFVRPASQHAVIEPIVVMNWVEEVRRLMAATGAR